MSQLIKSHLEYIFNGADQGFLSVSQFHPLERQGWFHVADELDGAAELMAELAQTGNSYYGYCLHNAPQRKGRGKADSVSLMPGFYLDLDFGQVGGDSRYAEGERHNNPPMGVREITAFLNDVGLPTPTMFIGTGNGIHGHYLFDEPLKLRTDDDRDKAHALWLGTETHVRIAANERGWTIDKVSDLARITRAVGTQNFGKPTHPHAPKPVVQLDGGAGVRYPVSELEKFASPSGGKLLKQPGRRPVEEEKNPANFDAIYAGCGFMRHFKDDGAKLSEPEWFAGLSIVDRCEGGFELAHELSRPYADYNHVETDFYARHAMQFPPRTCADIATRSTVPACETCPFRNVGIKSPITLGYSDPALVSLQRQYVYEVQRKLFIDRETLVELDKDGFNGLYTPRLKSPANTFIASELSPRVLKVDYMPGQPRVIGDGANGILNTYIPSDVVAEDGSCDSILGHISYLFPDPQEQGHLLDWLAYIVQRPDKKVGFALLIIGTHQGTGKTELIKIVREIIGMHNTVEVDNEELKGEFNARFQNKGLVLVEELMTDHRAESYNRLKVLISGKDGRANEKFQKRIEVKTANAFVFLTNHLKPIFMEPRERRFFVLRTESERKSDEHYAWLFGERFPAERGAFKRFLIERDLSGFQPLAWPPETAAKRDLIEWSRPPLQRSLREALEARVGCFSKDIGTQQDVVLTIANGGLETGGGPNAMHDALLSIGAARLPALRVGPKTVLNLWAWRNVEAWENATPEQRRNHIEGKPNLVVVGRESDLASPSMSALL